MRGSTNETINNDKCKRERQRDSHHSRNHFDESRRGVELNTSKDKSRPGVYRDRRDHHRDRYNRNSEVAGHRDYRRGEDQNRDRHERDYRKGYSVNYPHRNYR